LTILITRLPHACYMLATCLPHACHMLATCLPHACHQTLKKIYWSINFYFFINENTRVPLTRTPILTNILQYIDYRYFFVRVGLSHACHMLATCLSHTCHMLATCLPHACHMFVTCLSHACQIKKLAIWLSAYIFILS
jgi:hypothetical protein